MATGILPSTHSYRRFIKRKLSPRIGRKDHLAAQAAYETPSLSDKFLIGGRNARFNQPQLRVRRDVSLPNNSPPAGNINLGMEVTTVVNFNTTPQILKHLSRTNCATFYVLVIETRDEDVTLLQVQPSRGVAREIGHCNVMPARVIRYPTNHWPQFVT
jgi:hypothetical protein